MCGSGRVEVRLDVKKSEEGSRERSSSEGRREKGMEQ